MLETGTPSGGLVFFSLLYRSDHHSEETLHKFIESQFGEFITFNPVLNPLTPYYSKEMGDESLLKRFFLVSTKSFPRDILLTAKLQSLEWEKSWSEDSKRRVNVDVGLVSAENFILATTKNYSHRVYLGQNIFADLTYQCTEGRYQVLPWTYPDYKDQAKLEFFDWCRSYLLMLGKIDSF